MKEKPDAAIEDFLVSLREEHDHALDCLAIIDELRDAARRCYNYGWGRWRDVRNVVLVPGNTYLIRRVWWKTTARRGVATQGNICLARWRSGMPWEVLRGSLPGSTALLAGIQVYV